MIIQSIPSTNQTHTSDVRPVNVDNPRPAASPPVVEAKPAPEQVQRAVGTINKSLQLANRGLQFSVDPDTKNPVVRMVDTATGEVIRQIPSEESLAIARAIDKFQQGLLLKEKA